MMGPIEKKMESNEHDKLLADKNVLAAIGEILTELARAERLHPVWPEDTVHQVAIMIEEAGEAVQSANNYVHHGKSIVDAVQVRRELVQTGAMTIRCLMHLDI